ncbi:DUF4350 domain-containing protein [Tenacibaculum sp. M341]|uniref:DUF4350 domain-containing protein n=1 Tax=Tenacibaculum sp. M341 TaxID=2530339 RepID=UPI00104D956F|nr:DUF4350 domain-containing protein [Tenacibaculum sp. M341]TCI91106.1 hypothetical protein EYW44_12220 [Tenacibaculum sp. M341]
MVFTSCSSRTNWYENYKERSKDPFGTYIIANEGEELFGKDQFTMLDKHIEDYFYDVYYDNEADYANYVCIKSIAHRLDSLNINKLLNFVASGNDIFLSLNYMNSRLTDTLKVETTNLDSLTYNISKLKELRSTFKLRNKGFKETSYVFDRNIRRHYFSSFDPVTTTVLGTQKVGRFDHHPNFIKVKFYDGSIYLHTQPIAFTNYNLLNENKSYASNVLSYLPNRLTLWDPHIRRSKENARNQDRNDSTSALNFFSQHSSLKWSLYVAFIGLLTFLIFNARRKQRAIPEVKPLKNSTKDFIHTIANLYKGEQNHKNLATKKIIYFLEKIRSKYHIETRNLNKEFIEKLAAKSGNTVHTTTYLINTIITVNKRSECTQDELVRLNTLIENFLQNK